MDGEIAMNSSTPFAVRISQIRILCSNQRAKIPEFGYSGPLPEDRRFLGPKRTGSVNNSCTHVADPGQ